MDLSIVIPLYNEDESLRELTEWIHKVVTDNNISYEIVFIDDGSNDNSWQIIEQLSSEKYNISAVKFRRNYGKAAGLQSGFTVAKGDVVITMDADLQDSPDEIPELFDLIKNKGFDVISGWKKKRYDPILSKNLPSKLFNFAARVMSGIKLHDFNCGLKSYRSSVVKSIEIYGDMHRYIPILAKNAGFKKIGEKIVIHQKRKYGITKYGMSRFVNGFLDLISVTFMTKFAKKPMHFFGLLGSLSFFVGFGILVYFSISKIFFQLYNMTDRPLFYFGLLSLLFGTQLFLTGFVSEIVSRSSSDRNDYIIEKEIKF